MKFAGSMLKPVFDAINEHNITSALHVCRGNWTTDESVLLTGSYDKMAKLFDSLNVDVLALEFSTPRAGEVEMLFKNNFLDEKIILGIGVINPRDARVETVEEIMARAEAALEFLPPERIWLNPDCGFCTFANRPLNPYPIIEEKLTNMVTAAEQLRKKYM